MWSWEMNKNQFKEKYAPLIFTPQPRQTQNQCTILNVRFLLQDFYHFHFLRFYSITTCSLTIPNVPEKVRHVPSGDWSVKVSTASLIQFQLAFFLRKEKILPQLSRSFDVVVGWMSETHASWNPPLRLSLHNSILFFRTKRLMLCWR